LEELEKRNPPTDTGRRKVKHHQWLTEDIGHPALAEYLSGVLAIMKLSNNWDAFQRNLTKVYPVRGEQHNLELEEAARLITPHPCAWGRRPRPE
jgi:hypothetical protein